MRTRFLRHVLVFALIGGAVPAVVAQVQEPQADLAVTKTDMLDPVSVGGTITYTVTVANAGPDTAENVMLTDTLAAGVTLASAFMRDVGAVGSCRAPGRVVMCRFGTLASGESTAVTISVRTTAGGVIVNRATADSDTADPNLSNNTGREETTVGAGRQTPVVRVEPQAPAVTPACPNAEAVLDEAKDAYERGRTDQMLQLLTRPCLDALNKEQKTEALKLMAFAYFAMDRPDSTREAVRELVRKVDSHYEADSDDPPFFRDLVKKHRVKRYQRRWIQLTALAVVGGATSFFVFRPESQGDQPLPDPNFLECLIGPRPPPQCN